MKTIVIRKQLIVQPKKYPIGYFFIFCEFFYLDMITTKRQINNHKCLVTEVQVSQPPLVLSA